jgi:hypothetical protein
MRRLQGRFPACSIRQNRQARRMGDRDCSIEKCRNIPWRGRYNEQTDERNQEEHAVKRDVGESGRLPLPPWHGFRQCGRAHEQTPYQPCRRQTEERQAQGFMKLVIFELCGTTCLQSGHIPTETEQAANHIEGRVGHALFVKSRGSYVATPVGEMLVDTAMRIEETVVETERRLHGAYGMTGSIRLTAPDATATYLLLDLMSEFRIRHPDIVVEMLLENRVLSLDRREAGVAVSLTDAPSDGFIGRRLTRTSGCVYASLRHYTPDPTTPASPINTKPSVAAKGLALCRVILGTQTQI